MNPHAASTLEARSLELVHTGPIRPTPAGAFRAVTRAHPDDIGRFLRSLLREPRTPILGEEALMGWVGTDDCRHALEVLRAAQEDGFVEGLETVEVLPDIPLEDLVPPLLPTLSDEGRVLLADEEGLAAWSCGYDEPIAARLAAMSADLASLHDRHADALHDLLDGRTAAWALVDGIGASQIGCWPLYTGSTRFVLVAQGLPRLHHIDFTALVWLLVSRYG